MYKFIFLILAVLMVVGTAFGQFTDYTIALVDANGQPDTTNHTVQLVSTDGTHTVTLTRIGSNVWKGTSLNTDKVYTLKIDSVVKESVFPNAATLANHVGGHGTGANNKIAVADLVSAITDRIMTNVTVKTQVEGLNNGGVVADDKVAVASLQDSVVYRIFSDSTTAAQVEAAFDSNGKLDDDKCAAVQTRRILLEFIHIDTYSKVLDNIAITVSMGDEITAANRGGYFRIPALRGYASGDVEVVIAYLSPGDENDVVFDCEYKIAQEGETTASEQTDGVSDKVPNANTKIGTAIITLTSQDWSVFGANDLIFGRIYRGLAADGDTTVGAVKVIGAVLMYQGFIEED